MDVTLLESMTAILVRSTSRTYTKPSRVVLETLSSKLMLRNTFGGVVLIEMIWGATMEIQKVGSTDVVLCSEVHAMAESEGVDWGWHREEEQQDCELEKEEMPKGFKRGWAMQGKPGCLSLLARRCHLKEWTVVYFHVEQLRLACLNSSCSGPHCVPSVLERTELLCSQ